MTIIDGRDNKESSNLLQNSENLSLSDLELPEIEHQRKRKVRRKTRPRLTTSRQRAVSANVEHRSFILSATVFFVLSCWLLILSYTMSVIHIENQRLQNDLKKVSVISQNIPEEMQKWHEKSSLLEKNQSIIYEKLNELHVIIENLRANLSKYSARADIHNEYSKNDKFVADLGAKVEAFAIDMEVVKEHFTAYQKNNSKLQEDYNKLLARIDDIFNNTPESNKNETDCLQKVQRLEAKYDDDMKFIFSNISIANDTLTQKNIMLSDELLTHKSKLNDLMDVSANITSQVISIKNDFAAKYENMENVINDIVHKTSICEKEMQELRSNCSLSEETYKNCGNLVDTVSQKTNVESQRENRKRIEN